MYYKITNAKENHHGFQYHDGLNILTEPFVVTGSCVGGGFIIWQNIETKMHKCTNTHI